MSSTVALGIKIGASLAGGFKSTFSSASSEVKKLEAATKKADSSLGAMYKEQAKRSKESAGLGFGGTAGIVGAAYAFSQPIKQAVKFESEMADVRKVVDMSDAEFNTLGKSILDMSTKIPMAASGIASIVAEAGQSGVAKEELMGFALAASKMGVAFDMSGQEAGSTMASWRAGMAINQKQAESLADAVNYLDSKMNASAKNISDVIRRQGAVAKAAGLNEIQIAALSAALLNSGAESEVAATALKNLTNALTKGDSATKAQVAVFDQLGLKSSEVTKQMQQDAEGTIKMVFSKLAQAPAEMRGALVGDLFGEEAKGAIMPLLVNLQALEKAFGSVGDASQYAGSMQKEYDVRSKTTENNLQLLSNTVTKVGVTFGSALLPALNIVLEPMARVATWVGGMIEDMPAIAYAIGGLAVGIGAYATYVGGAAAAQWAWNVAMAANPIGVLIAAVALAATAIYTHWEPISEWVGEHVFKPIEDKANALKGVIESIGKAWEWAKGIGSAVSDFFSAPANASMRPVGATAGSEGKSGFMTPVRKTDLPSSATPSGAQNGNNSTTTNTFHITQLPGENSEAFARRIVDEQDRRKKADQRRALHD